MLTICPTCGQARTLSNPHPDCDERAMDAARSAYLPGAFDRSPVTERIVNVKMGDHQGEYLDAERTSDGYVKLRHFTPGTKPADTVVLDADEAARLATFIIKTLGRGRGGGA